jgi:hypothetical protein
MSIRSICIRSKFFVAAIFFNLTYVFMGCDCLNASQSLTISLIIIIFILKKRVYINFQFITTKVI